MEYLATFRVFFQCAARCRMIATVSNSTGDPATSSDTTEKDAKCREIYTIVKTGHHVPRNKIPSVTGDNGVGVYTIYELCCSDVRMDFVNEKKYKKKTRKLKRLIKDLVFENAALCDQIAIIQEKELIVREERKFLLRKYHSFQTVSADSIPYQFQSPCTQPYSQTVSIHGQETTVRKTFARKKNNFDSPDGNRSCKNKRSYAVAKAKKLVQPIPLDVAGRPVFPIILGGPTVHSLGEVVSDRPGYHTEDYIFPVGFCSTRVYGSLRDPEKKCVYTCKVLDGGQAPSFEIVADNELDAPLVAKSASDCHSMLLRHINNAVGYDVVNTKGRGPEFFGLSHPTIQNLIQSCPGTRKCSLYKWSKFEVSRSAELPIEENDASLNFDALQRSIAFYKLYMHMLHEEQPVEPVTRENNLRDLLMA